MDNQVAVGLAFVSVGLPVGWAWYQQNRAASYRHPPKRVRQVAQFFYFIGLPYLAVVVGVITPRFLGLVGVEHLSLVDWRNPAWPGEFQLALTLILLDWFFDAPTTLGLGVVALAGLAGLCFGLRRYRVVLFPHKQPWLQTAYHALHWTFYRAIFWRISGDLYLATVIGAGLVLLEWVLVDWLEARPDSLNGRLTHVIILILTATIFYFSPNWWLLLPVHLAMVAVVNGFAPAPSTSSLVRSTRPGPWSQPPAQM